jgi:hypothetical protein
VLPEPLPEDHLPLLGRIAAGRPIEAVVGAESIQVPAALRTARPCYVLQVVGDSMREAGILDSDYVVVEHSAQARNGAIVVALIRGQEATRYRGLSADPKAPVSERSGRGVDAQGRGGGAAGRKRVQAPNWRAASNGH